MNRDEVIEQLLDQYREQLEEKDNEELLGTTLDKMRENAIEAMVERYQESVEEMDDEFLFGDSLEEARETAIEEILERHQDDLEAMTTSNWRSNADEPECRKAGLSSLHDRRRPEGQHEPVAQGRPGRVGGVLDQRRRQEGCSF